jgi:hypothetical protein
VLSFPFCSYLTFWWGNEVKRSKRSPVLVLNAKGGEIKAKANGLANHLWISKILELESLCLIKPFYCKIVLLWGRSFIMGKGAVCGIWSNLLLKYLSICPNKCVWLRDRKKILFWVNKPSGGKRWSKYAKFYVRKIGLQSALFKEWYCTLGCFLMCWHKSPKRGRLKGKCALGPYL